MVAIVGPTEQGNVTIIKSLERFHDPQGGLYLSLLMGKILVQ